MSQRFSRREFLKISGAVTGSLILSNLVACAPKSGTTTGTVAPVNMNIWSWHPEVIQDNLKHFADDYGLKTNLSIVTGDYNTVMEVKILTKAPLDVLYSFPDRANRWYRMSGIMALDEMPGITDILNDMYPASKASVTAYDGKIYGLPYGIISTPLYTNEKVLKAAGFEGQYPQTWDDMLQQCTAIKSKGLLDYPYLPRWEKTSFGITWAFWAQCISEGEELFDKDTNPIFDTNTPIMAVLENWVKFWEANLVPQSVLASTETDVLNSWKGGLHAYTVQDDYYNRDFNDASLSKIAGYSSFATQMPGSTHKYMMLPLLYTVENRERSKDQLDALWTFLKFLAWKNKSGLYYVCGRFARDYGIMTAYPKAFDSADVQQGYLSKVMRPQDLNTIKNIYLNAELPGAWKGAVWYPQWDVAAMDVLQDVIQKNITVEDGVKKLKDSATQLQAQYA